MKKSIIVLFLLSIAICIRCSAHPLSTSIGFKKIESRNRTKNPNLYITRFHYSFLSGNSYVNSADIYLDNLKKAIEAALYNSGKFEKVFFDPNGISKENLQAEITVMAEDDWKALRYPDFDNLLLSAVFFLPNSICDPDQYGNRCFWPGLLGYYPAVGYFPFFPKAGRAQVRLTFLLYSKNGLQRIDLKEHLPYHFMFYGIYRTSAVEDLFPVVYSKLLEKLSMHVSDLNL